MGRFRVPAGTIAGTVLRRPRGSAFHNLTTADLTIIGELIDEALTELADGT